MDGDLGDRLGEDLDPDAAIEGRTSEDHFQPFFNEKTFGAGEAGKVRGSRRAGGGAAALRLSRSRLSLRLWPATPVREEEASGPNGEGAFRVLHRGAHRGGSGRGGWPRALVRAPLLPRALSPPPTTRPGAFSALTHLPEAFTS